MIGESESEQREVNVEEKIYIKRMLYRDLKLTVLLTAGLCLSISAIEAVYKSSYVSTTLLFGSFLVFLFLILLISSNLDEARFASKLPVDEAIQRLFKKDVSLIFLFVPAGIVCLLILHYIALSSNASIYRPEDWNDGRYDYTPIDDRPNAKNVDIADPCKVFDNLCSKDAIRLISLISNGYEIKNSALAAGTVLVQKANNSYLCRPLQSKVSGFVLPAEASLGSAVCSQLREALPKDMKAGPLNDYSSDYAPVSSKANNEDYSSFGDRNNAKEKK